MGKKTKKDEDYLEEEEEEYEEEDNELVEEKDADDDLDAVSEEEKKPKKKRSSSRSSKTKSTKNQKEEKSKPKKHKSKKSKKEERPKRKAAKSAQKSKKMVEESDEEMEEKEESEAEIVESSSEEEKPKRKRISSKGKKSKDINKKSKSKAKSKSKPKPKKKKEESEEEESEEEPEEETEEEPEEKKPAQRKKRGPRAPKPVVEAPKPLEYRPRENLKRKRDEEHELPQDAFEEKYKPLSVQAKKEWEAFDAKMSTHKKKEHKKRKTESVEKVDTDYGNRWTEWEDWFLVSTDLAHADQTFKYKWSFNNFFEQVYDSEGKLFNEPLYCFVTTEPQEINGDIVPIPVIVCAATPIPLPNKVGIKSVQMKDEIIKDMDEMKLYWNPFHSEEGAVHLSRMGKQITPKKSKSGGRSATIHLLSCLKRRPQLNKLKTEDFKEYEYVLPYFFRPKQLKEKESDESADVIGNVEIEGKGVALEFNYKDEDINERVKEICEENELDEKVHGTKIKAALEEAVAELKNKNAEERAKFEHEVSALAPETKEIYDNMKFYKFYPSHPKMNIQELKSTFINRYIGHAAELL